MGILQMLQELAKNDPAMMTRIRENQEDFMRLLSEPVPAEAAMDDAFGGGGEGAHTSCPLS